MFYIDAIRGAKAKGMIVSDGFAVLKGSTIANAVTPSFPKSSRRLRDELIENGTIDENFCFVKDFVFSSPSQSAEVVLGRSANGKTEWKNSKHKTINDIEG